MLLRDNLFIMLTSAITIKCTILSSRSFPLILYDSTYSSILQKVLQRKIITNQEVFELLGQEEESTIWKEYLTDCGLTLAPGESISQVIHELQGVCDSLSKVELLALANNLPISEAEVGQIIGQGHPQGKQIAEVIQMHKKVPALVKRESSGSRKK